MTNHRVLIADDDRVIVSSLGKGLLDAGYGVVVASDGAQAVELGCAEKIDLAVLDIRMPQIFGIEVARQLRDRAGVPSIFLSAFTDKELVALAIKEGALGYLVKPVTAMQLIPAIQAALERHAELRRLQETEASMAVAIRSNRDISLAIGVYMERYKVPAKQAVDTLRDFARSKRCKLVDIARTLTRENPQTERLFQRIWDFSQDRNYQLKGRKQGADPGSGLQR